MRKYTNKIIEMVDEGSLDRDTLIRDLLMWMSEYDVEEFYDRNLNDDEDEDEEDDYDGQPSEMDEWHDFDPDC
jgi:hypothetical protein